MTYFLIDLAMGFTVYMVGFYLGKRRGRYEAVRDLAPRKTKSGHWRRGNTV